jgi:membrane protease YdiL (CAAX protease family)
VTATRSWTQKGRKALQALPTSLVEKVPRDHWESDAAFHRRRQVVAGTAIAGAGLLGVSLSTRPDSKEFYALTLSAASVWTIGGLTSGPLHLGLTRTGDTTYRRPVVAPILTGVGAFAAFYGGALVSRHIPVLNDAITSILQYAHQGSDRLVLFTTLANGAAEEVFFRGALYAAVGADHPVALSTASYMLATTATRNPALVLASGAMGLLFAVQRRASGGIQASTLTHLTWSTLMLRYLPPLFNGRPRSGSSGTLRPTSKRPGVSVQP